MESIGKKLKDERRSRGIDIDQAARETNIARRYIEDLENERFDSFPAESYVIGFLRNYCEYLELDADGLISIYKNQKIQEINIPISELIPERSLGNRVLGSIVGKIAIALVVLALLAGLGFGGYMLFKYLAGRIANLQVEPHPSPSRAAYVREPAVYEMSGREFRGRVFVGDSISVPVEGEVFAINVQETAPDLMLETGGAIRVVELGQSISFNISEEFDVDIRVFVSDLDISNPSAGAEITVELGPFDEELIDAEGELEMLSMPTVGVSSSSGSTVLFESYSAYPVTMNATFRGTCLFRHEIDRRNREERMYQRSEVLTVQARDGLRVWASNGNAVRIQIIAGGRTAELPLSRPGEVIVKDLRWTRDSSTGRYNFVAMDVE